MAESKVEANIHLLDIRVKSIFSLGLGDGVFNLAGIDSGDSKDVAADWSWMLDTMEP